MVLLWANHYLLVWLTCISSIFNTLKCNHQVIPNKYLHYVDIFNVIAGNKSNGSRGHVFRIPNTPTDISMIPHTTIMPKKVQY